MLRGWFSDRWVGWSVSGWVAGKVLDWWAGWLMAGSGIHGYNTYNILIQYTLHNTQYHMQYIYTYIQDTYKHMHIHTKKHIHIRIHIHI